MKIIIKIEDILISGFLILYALIILFNIWTISTYYADLKFTVQKQGVIIEALSLSCEMDFLIKKIGGSDNEGN